MSPLPTRMTATAESVMPVHSDSSPTAITNTLSGSWTLWAHLPHDTDWSLSSYKRIFTASTVEEAIAVTESLPDALVRNCMLFLMREGIQPTWEDKRNRNGGCFSYKVVNKIVPSTWKSLMLCAAGETVSHSAPVSADITGITISPKKNFCIIKVWMGSCKFQDPSSITAVSGVAAQGCIFRKQTPEY